MPLQYCFGIGSKGTDKPHMSAVFLVIEILANEPEYNAHKRGIIILKICHLRRIRDRILYRLLTVSVILKIIPEHV